MKKILVQQAAWIVSIQAIVAVPVARADDVVAGPDVIYSGVNGIQSHGAVGDIRAYTLGSHTCNIGNQNLIWASSGSPGLAMNSYRLHDGRLMQIGMSWVKTACCAAANNGCGLACNFVGGQMLGAGCRDTYTAGWNSGQARLAPRSAINAFTGAFQSFPPTTGNAIFKRMQIKESELMASNFPGAQYFVEGIYVGSDDAQSGNAMNNASYAQATVNPGMTMVEAGPINTMIPAIFAWRDHGNGPNNPDSSVEIRNLDVPNEGRFILASKVREVIPGMWRYDYAVYNFSSDKCGGSFSVPITGGVQVADIGFHDIDHHSGEPYDGTDWGHAVVGETVRWTSPQTFAQNPNSNAMRWGTMYSFWFTANTPPEPGDVTLGLFKPHTPSSVVGHVMVPSAACTLPQIVEPAAGVSFDNRAFDDFIDARAESNDGVNLNLGMDRITFEFTTAIENIDGTPLSPQSFLVWDNIAPGPSVDHVETEDGRVVTLVLNRHIDVQQWTNIQVYARAQCNQSLVILDSIRIGYLPGDIDQNRIVNPLDLLRFKQYVNNVANPAVGVEGDFIDTNRDGAVDPVDLLVFKRLLNGVSPPATRVWSGQSLP